MSAWLNYLWYEFVYWLSFFLMFLGWSLRINGRQRACAPGRC